MIIAVQQVIMSVSQIFNSVVSKVGSNGSVYEEYKKTLDLYKKCWAGFDDVDKKLIGSGDCKKIEDQLLELQELINTEAEEEKIDKLVESLYDLMFGKILKECESEWNNFSKGDKELLGSKICDRINGDINRIKELRKQGGNEEEILRLLKDLEALLYGHDGSMSLKERVKQIKELNENKDSMSPSDYNELLEYLQKPVNISMEDFKVKFSTAKARRINVKINDEAYDMKYSNLTKNLSMSMKVILAQNRYKEFEIENNAYSKSEERAKMDPEMKKYLENGAGILDNNSMERRAMVVQEEINNEMKNKAKG